MRLKYILKVKTPTYIWCKSNTRIITASIYTCWNSWYHNCDMDFYQVTTFILSLFMYGSRCCEKKSCGNRNETPSDPVIIDRQVHKSRHMYSSAYYIVTCTLLLMLLSSDWTSESVLSLLKQAYAHFMLSAKYFGNATEFHKLYFISDWHTMPQISAIIRNSNNVAHCRCHISSGDFSLTAQPVCVIDKQHRRRSGGTDPFRAKHGN